jgi:hypothetical protein
MVERQKIAARHVTEIITPLVETRANQKILQAHIFEYILSQSC